MSSVPLSDRLHAGARALMIALGDRHRGLPLWAVTYLQTAIERLRRGAVDLLRKLEAGTYRPRKPGLARRPCATPRAPRPAPAIRFPGFRGIVIELIGNQRGGSNHRLDELLQDPALPTYVQACPALASRLRPLCRLAGVAIPAWLRPPPKPRRPRATPAPGPIQAKLAHAARRLPRRLRLPHMARRLLPAAHPRAQHAPNPLQRSDRAAAPPFQIFERAMPLASVRRVCYGMTTYVNPCRPRRYTKSPEGRPSRSKPGAAVCFARVSAHGA